MRRMTRGSYGLAKLWEKRDRLPTLSAWGKRWQLFLQALRGIRTSPFTSFLTIATIAASLVMLGLSILFIQNFGSAIGQSADALKISVYLNDDASDAQREVITKTLRARQGVKKIEYRDKSAALKEFRKSLGDHSDLLDGLAADNPLPASLEVSMDEAFSEPEQLRDLAQIIKTQAGVEEVRLNEATLVEVAKVLSFLRTLSFVAIVLILLITGFIISNTIKLGLYVYHDEITIMRLVGASPSYIRAPFLIEGGIKGCVGAIASLVIVYGIYAAFINSIQNLSLFQLLLPTIRFPGILAMTLIILVGIAVGVSGSSLAVRGGLEETE